MTTRQSGANVRVHVTQQDIDNAIPQDSRHCAVADAVARTVNALRVTADIATIRYSLDSTDRRYVYLTPVTVQDYIIAFDGGETLKPFSFTLGRPIWTGKIGHRHVKGTRHVAIGVDKENGTHQEKVVHVENKRIPRRKGGLRVYGMRQMRPNAREDATPRIG